MQLRIALVATVMFVALEALSHEDTRLTLRADGTMPELPAHLGPINLWISWSEGEPSRITDIRFRAAGKESRLPECLVRQIGTGSQRGVLLSGSWYHDERITPYYIQANFFGAPAARRQRGATPDDYKIVVLFNLRNSEVINVWRNPPGTATYESGTIQMTLAESCRPQP